jgi:hypothetical protein
MGCDQLMAVVRGAGHPAQPWRERLATVVTGYLSALDAMPAVNRTLLVEIQAAGPRAYRLRQETQQLQLAARHRRPAGVRGVDLPAVTATGVDACVRGAQLIHRTHRGRAQWERAAWWAWS